MEKQVIFRDNQEQQAADHTDLQNFTRQSIDHLVNDAITVSRRYSGFDCAKTAQAEVTVQPGRFFDQGGAIYARSTSLVQSVVAFLPAVAKRIVTVAVNGVENQVDVEERDFLINVETGETEPDAVAMTRSRDTIISFVQGSESADPQAPLLPATSVAVANILLDPTQAVSITMIEANQVASTEDLDERAKLLEAFKAAIEPRVSSLASDIAALANQIAQLGQQRDLSRIYEDLARVKERVAIPQGISDYGADRYLTEAQSDVTNVALQGYDAKVEEGIRFADANADEFEMDIFSANDPNAAKASNGLLLPAYDHVLKMSIGPFNTDVGIAQFGFQTYEIVQRTISRERIRYGSIYTHCTNDSWWKSGVYDPVTQTFRKGGETFIVLNPQDALQDHKMVRLQQFWVDRFDEPYWEFVTINHVINGAQVAQSFLVANDMWLTRVGFWVTVKAAPENVFLTLCEVSNGVPDLSKAIMHQTVPHTDLVVNTWTRVDVLPTFLKAGKRYALVFTSNANHKVGMASGQNFLDGTFFSSTDGAFFQGDLTKDMMLELWGAKFRAPQVTIELEAINLDGGIRAIDILAGTIRPESTDLVYEIQPSGSGDWIPLKPESLDALTGAPVLFHFRARFVGTRDIMPGLMLTGSRVFVSRPKITFKHVSTQLSLVSPKSTIFVKVLLENFNETPHNLTAFVRTAAGVNELPDITTDAPATSLTPADVAAGRVERTFQFNTAAPVQNFRIIINGDTNSPANTFHVSERIYWAT